MHSSLTKVIRIARPARPCLAVAATTLGFLLQAPLARAAMPPTGIACTESTSPSPTFALTATDGYIQLTDGNTMYMWSYANGGGAFQYPGPVLCVNEGDTVTVVLNNSLPEEVSIMFPGQENVLANGVPAQPQGSGAALTSLTNTAAPGGSVTYSFVASKPGTYIYESGTSPQKQVRMGLFGALIVRPTLGAGYMFDRPDSRFTTNATFASQGTNTYTANEEYMVLLSEIDPYQHQAAETGGAFDFDGYQARYWLINGRGFPDSISDNGSPFLPEQPYGALARIHPYDAAIHPYPGSIRYLNVATEEIPFHPHGQNGSVIGRDGSPLANAAGEDLSFEKFAINIGPGQTWDVLFKWLDAEGYNSSTNPIPVVQPQVNNQEFGIFYSGSPYLGESGTLPPGASTLNTCGEYYIISHNHALYQITSWGVNLTGPITYVRVDPTNCVPITR
ncbi:MAG: multicopper oxidase domain-containing protein [Steroidobacteraceae bacterium]